MVGGSFAFMMLSARVAQPLVGLARLVQEYEEVNAAIGEAVAVLNRPLEIDAASGGLRPKFAGAISFQDVTFTFGGTGAATVNLAVEHGQEALDIGRVAGLDDTSRIKPLLPVVRLSLCPHCTSRLPLTMMSTWPCHMKGLEMRFVSALFLWAFSEADGNDGLCPIPAVRSTGRDRLGCVERRHTRRCEKK